jgi:hypothetical protein
VRRLAVIVVGGRGEGKEREGEWREKRDTKTM